MGLRLDDLIKLQIRLISNEFAIVKDIDIQTGRVNKITTILNNRKALPRKYNSLVKVWNGFKGKEEDEELFILSKVT